MARTLFCIDIDGCISHATRRLIKAGQEPSRSNKERYMRWVEDVQSHESLLQDNPVPGTVTMINALATTGDVIYVTARNEEFRNTTLKWLIAQGFPVLPLHMRGRQDWSDSGEYKKNVVLKESTGYSSVVVFDDDIKGDIEDVCHEHGWTFFKSRTGTLI